MKFEDVQKKIEELPRRYLSDGLYCLVNNYQRGWMVGFVVDGVMYCIAFDAINQIKMKAEAFGARNEGEEPPPEGIRSYKELGLIFGEEGVCIEAYEPGKYLIPVAAATWLASKIQSKFSDCTTEEVCDVLLDILRRRAKTDPELRGDIEKVIESWEKARGARETLS